MARHDPAHACGRPNPFAVQPGGGLPADRSGLHAAPALRYGQSVRSFSERFFDNGGDDSVDLGPTGGRTWDGRVSLAREQARTPRRAAAAMRLPSSNAWQASNMSCPHCRPGHWQTTEVLQAITHCRHGHAAHCTGPP